MAVFRFLLLLGLPLSFLVLMVFLPVAGLIWEGQQFWQLTLLSDSLLQWRFMWSCAQAALTCVCTLLLGVPVSWVLARYEFTGRKAVLRLLMLPFVMPTLVAGMGVLALFGPHGLWYQVPEDTPWLLLYGNLFYNLPLVIRAGIEGFSQVSARHLAAARSLGGTRWRVFWRIEWPQARPWLMSAQCLVFLYCFAGFGLALLLGGQLYATVEVEIYTLVAHQLNLSDAGMLALVTMSFCALIAWLYAVAEQRLARPLFGAALPRQRATGVADVLLLLAALAVLALFAVAPLAALLWRALGQKSLVWQVWLHQDTLLALTNTLIFTAVALLGAIVLGSLHALAARQSLWLRALVFAPLIASPVCVAFGLLLMYPSFSASLGLLLGAYILLAYPFIAKSLAANFDSQPASLIAVARTLGASPTRAFFRVTWPLARPAFRRGMAFAAATTVGEFAVTLFLSRPEWNTLTTLIYQRLGYAGSGNLATAWVLSSGLMLLAWAVFMLMEWPVSEQKYA